MNKMQLVEQHVIKKTNKNYHAIKELSHKSKNLYNYANYILRQEFISKKSQIKEYDLTSALSAQNQVDYRALPAQTSQQTIKLLYKNWKSFFVALKAYKKDKSKFNNSPRIPKYKKKDGLNIVVFTNQQISLKNNYINFPKLSNLKPIKTKASSIKQVRIIPKSACFMVEVVYEKEILKHDLLENSFLGIDLGLNNFVTALDNQAKRAFIIKGGAIKSVNQFFNKLKAHYQAKAKKSNGRFFTKRLSKLNFKRDCKVNDFMHKASNIVLSHCLEHKIANVVVGHNKEWKQNSNLGKRTNQAFQNICFQSFIEKLKYKCELNGINFILTEESYSSKCDHLAGEEMKHQERYLGKRTKRGLFVSSTGKMLNADVNGALGILLKVFPNAINSIGDSGIVSMPRKIHTAV